MTKQFFVLGVLLVVLVAVPMYAKDSSAQNDLNYPKVFSILAAPHRSFGTDVQGSRSVFDNPDTTYCPVPIDPSAHYVITGKILPNMPLDLNFSLWDIRNSNKKSPVNLRP
jgi:hypothetical protein